MKISTGKFWCYIRLLQPNYWQSLLYLEQVRAKLEERRDNGQLGYGAYLHWVSVLELYSEPEQFYEGITEDSPYLRKLRRRTPFVGMILIRQHWTRH